MRRPLVYLKQSNQRSQRKQRRPQEQRAYWECVWRACRESVSIRNSRWFCDAKISRFHAKSSFIIQRCRSVGSWVARVPVLRIQCHVVSSPWNPCSRVMGWECNSLEQWMSNIWFTFWINDLLRAIASSASTRVCRAAKITCFVEPSNLYRWRTYHWPQRKAWQTKQQCSCARYARKGTLERTVEGTQNM